MTLLTCSVLCINVHIILSDSGLLCLCAQVPEDLGAIEILLLLTSVIHQCLERTPYNLPDVEQVMGTAT